jgi:hypothetical protein
MNRIQKMGLVCLLLLGIAAANAQDRIKVDALAAAISHAEGYGRRGALPTRYRNPGDIKTRAGVRLPGQKRIGKGGHIVFATDAAGWDALRAQISAILDGGSRHYTADMTLAQMARRYAARWRPWAAIVSRELGVSPQTTLRAYFTPAEVKLPEVPLTTSRMALDFAPQWQGNDNSAGGGL